MRTLFVSPRQCWPALSGAKLREYHFARALGQAGPLTYLYFGDPQQPLTTQELPFCEQVVGVPKPAAYGKVQLAKGILTRWPLPVLNYTSEAMFQMVHKLTEASQYDLVHLDSIHMIRYSGALSKQPIVYNWHNIESEALERYSNTVLSPARRWYAKQTARKLALLENDILDTAFGHVVCSERERQQLHRNHPHARIEVVENGVDVEYFSGAADLPSPAAASGKEHLIFVGSMDYYPNIEAAISFTRNIWPSLRQTLPNLQLLIVGAKPAAEVLALNGQNGITVTGTVADVRPYYGGALAAIVPLRTGGGTRLKILEAMAAGIPVISTPIGAEGLAVTPDRDILFAESDDAAMWTRHVQTAAGSLRSQLSAAALDLVRTRYDWGHLGRQLSNTYREWLRQD